MTDSPSRELSETDLYALLAHRRRRLLVRLLQDFEAPMTAAELATLVAKCEYEEPTADLRRVVTLSLHHDHLPRLAEAEVVDYDEDDGTVTPGSNFGTLVGVITDRAADDSFVG